MFITIIFLSSLMWLFYFYNKESFKYWTRRGFKQLKPKIFVGNVHDLIMQKKSLAEFFEDIYRNSKSNQVIGIYFFYRPALVINDAEIAKVIMENDFQYFQDRGLLFDEKVDPLSTNLFCQSGDSWKNLRQKLTPLFSSTKLKGMMPTINKSVDILLKFIDENNDGGRYLFDLREMLTGFTLTMISSTGFGVEDYDCINEPNNAFRTIVSKCLKPSFINNLRVYLAFLAPRFCKLFRIRFTDKIIFDFFNSLVNKTIDYREKNNITRQDFLQLLMELKNSSSNKLTSNELIANAFIFVIAGYESTAETMSYCLYELARYPQKMSNVQEELDLTLNGDFSYEKLKELNFLECCINEALRKYPVVPIINRIATHDYEIPGTSLKIPKNTPIIIPHFGMQRDPDLIENPLEFRPERFADRNYDKKNLIIPFGLGQRSCPGYRMAKVIAKLCISRLLYKYDLILKSSHGELKFNPKVAPLISTDQILVNFKPRNSPMKAQA